MKKDKLKHCVFVDPQFITLFPNLDSWIRDGNIFDCISVSDRVNYLNIVAVHNKFPDIVDTLNIWIPTSFIQLVIYDGYEKFQIGFQSSTKKEAIENQRRYNTHCIECRPQDTFSTVQC